MKCEYIQFADGVVRLTTVFESRDDMEKFKEVYDQFASLLPEKPAPKSTGDNGSSAQPEKS